MYARLESKKKCNLKKVGKMFLFVTKDETACLYIMLGLDAQCNYILYEIAKIKSKSKYSTTQYTTNNKAIYVEIDQLRCMMEYFVKKSLSEPISIFDLKSYRVLSADFMPLPIEQPKIPIEQLEKWYMKSRLMSKGMPDIKFTTDKTLDLKPVTKKDLRVGHLYIDYRKYPFVYLGMESGLYCFVQATDEDEYKKGVIHIQLADKLNHHNALYDVKCTSAVPKLYDMSLYPVERLPYWLQDIRQYWVNKDFQIEYYPCAYIKSSDFTLLKSHYMSYPDDTKTVKAIVDSRVINRAMRQDLRQTDNTKEYDLKVDIIDYPDKKECYTLYFKKLGKGFDVGLYE